MKKILFLALPFLAFHLVALAAAVPFSDESGPLVVKSPNGALSFELIPGDKDLSFTIRAGKLAVVDLSPLRFSLDGASLTEGAVIRDRRQYKLSEKYPWLGVHSTAVNDYNGLELQMMHGKMAYTLDIRVFNDGAAFRIVVPGAESDERVPDEATVFNLPGASSLWYHDLVGHYEGVHVKKELSQVQAGEWVALPATLKLPQGIYVAVTEAA
ncbi:MAG TPA: glycoside hydrolase family 97 N-terminal domain-containing protein, partial [Puia sp.]|nr:glycoside hydrolase family 97 N-terminal domain-containing protein [Puia sp.]